MITPSRLRWGLIFIIAGVLLILNNTGALSWEYWWELVVWWPLLLIAYGIEKIFQKTSISFVSYISPIMLSLAMIYIAFQTGPEGNKRNFFSVYDWDESADSSIHLIEADIDHGRTDLYVSDEAKGLASARFERFARKPNIKFSKDAGVARLEIKRGFWRGDGFLIFDRKRSGRDWNIHFSPDTPLKLQCRGDAADINLNLETIPLEQLTIEDNNGDIYLKLGDLKQLVNLEINGKESHFRFRYPQKAGLKVLGDNYSGYLKTMGYINRDGYYFSDGYDTSKVQISLKLNRDLSHLSLDSY